MAKSVLIVGMDGLQPAQVTPELMPKLSAFAAGGVAFDNHHSVFPTVTRVNATSMLTGRHPGGHGINANTAVIRETDPHGIRPALMPELMELKHKTGRVLLAPHLADILGSHDLPFASVGVGSNGNSFLQNPNPEVSGGATIHPEFTFPAALNAEIKGRFGPWAARDLPDTARFAQSVRMVTEYVIPEREPAVCMMWSSEPDFTQHATGVGSEPGRRAVAGADRQFGVLLDWLERSGRAADTDVMVISDHGYSTITGDIAIEPLVRAAGFPPADHRGGVAVAANGGSVLFYVHDKDWDTADRLAAWLMLQPWCGPLVASRAIAGIEGVLPATLVGAEGERAPDLMVSFAWDSAPNGAGFAGHAYNHGKPAGLGQHGSMSPHEIRCVLFARGPSFKSGARVPAPSGNIDLAPTVLEVLGLPGEEAMDGRVLREAFRDGPGPGSIDWTTETHAASRKLATGAYSQQISVSRVGATVYADEGRARRDG